MGDESRLDVMCELRGEGPVNYTTGIMVGDHAALGGAYTRLLRPRQHTGLTKTTKEEVDDKDHKGTVSEIEEIWRNTNDGVSRELSRNLGDLTIDWSLVFQLAKLGRLELVWSLSKGEIENGE